ncbi:MAG TPA: undecaprenyldiphospho-muramoylpentapeptide beta-N-acetylglucosaminyltransferase [Xanthobacteraceae bacterium]|nr:undecaprenyldiphospho-muramoylpentapeptide beta-N-acetylglucosaminyltransferase [Xanthobacteraceae bacterium]
MSDNNSPLVVVAAGGTGGHLFPAEALTVALGKRGVVVDLATDERATRYGAAFPARTTHIVPSATLRKSDPVTYVTAPLSIVRGILQAKSLLGGLRPAAVIGFGGYPTVPPLLAACWLKIPTLIHEQNGVLGRANRMLAPFVTAIATGFPKILDAHPKLAAKATVTGNPVRPAVVAASKQPYTASLSGSFRLVVFGGSQGARVMADVVPAAIELLPAEVRSRLVIVQQARDEDATRVKEIYARLAVASEVEPFFTDMPARIAAGHLVVARSGASTVAELAAIGRPGILVPLPHALDQDQAANAAVLEKAGGALRVNQSDFTPKFLAAEIGILASEPQRLAAMAEAARLTGAIDAADRLADLVLRVAGLTAR